MRYLATTFLASSMLLAGCSFNPHVQSPEELAKFAKQETLLQQAKSATSPEDTIAKLNQAGELGSGSAYYNLAKIYATDKRVPQDFKKAQSYLTKADELGNNDATIMLAWNYMYGIRMEKDEDRGVELMKKAAKSDPRAKREMGLMYGDLRHPFLSKPSKGLILLTEAGDEGDAEAFYYSYVLAKKLDKPKVAERSLLMAVKNTQPKALLVAGRDALKKGQFMISRDYLLKSALANDSEAMFELGKGIADGVFPPSQTVDGISREAEAYAWLNLATQQQHLQAQEKRDALAKTITVDDAFKKKVLTVTSSIEEQVKPWNPNKL